MVQGIARWVYEVFNLQTSWLYWVMYFWLVVAFTFFYTVVIYQQQNIAENLQRQGGFIPGIRPGRPTAEYLYKVLTRITLVGALFLGTIAILPFLVRSITNVQALTLQSTALLIVVGVALDTMRQLESQLLMRHYRGFINR
jgi:preprotein translocase subunit SecY